ncbi:MAG TPA: patatin-like phospholipase family protein [Gemmatimonas sp.]|nr:patatin-like phospholipase family protein [Gemmatimonas sp.]
MRSVRYARTLRAPLLRALMLATLSGLPVLGACAVNRRPTTTIAALQSDADGLRVIDRALRDSVIERLVRRAKARGDGKLDMLLLSGGGQNGAFGVGFLRGWSARTDMPLPRFDLVSGVSTGALQAPYALLGTPAALDTVTALYRRAADRIAPTVDWLFWLRRTGGVVQTKRFDQTLEASIDGQFRDDLRRAFADDRQLLFPTADFDLGIGRLWSLGDALDSSAAGLARARQLLKAATAIPGIFPPVMIDGHLHGDGGVTANVLIPLQYGDYQRLGARLAEAGLRNVTIRTYVIMNWWTHPPVVIVPPSNRKKISARTNNMLVFNHQPETLQNLSNLAAAVSASIPGLTMELKVTELPSYVASEPGASKLFQKEFMRRLEDLGVAKAGSATPWDAIPSAYARPSRDR